METKITLEQILVAEQAIAKLGESRLLPAKTKYWIGKLIDTCSHEVKRYQELRVEALNKFGTAPENPTDAYTFENGKRAEFEQEIKDLLATEIDLKLVKLTLDDLDKTELSAIEMNSIGWLIEEGGEDE